MDDADVESLYRRYGPMVIRRCRRILRDPDEAQDVAQEVFVQVLKRRERLDARHPSSLLFRIATNLSLNRLRDRRRRPESPVDEVLEAVAALPDPDERLLLDRLLRRHTEGTRLVAMLYHVDGMTLEEVARECGLSVSGVRKRLRTLRLPAAPGARA